MSTVWKLRIFHCSNGLEREFLLAPDGSSYSGRKQAIEAMNKHGGYDIDDIRKMESGCKVKWYDDDPTLPPNWKTRHSEINSKNGKIPMQWFLNPEGKMFRGRKAALEEIQNSGKFSINEIRRFKFVISMENIKTERTVDVQGIVNEPGEYPFFEGMTARDLVLIANGFDDRANTDQIELYTNVTELGQNKRINARWFSFKAQHQKHPDGNSIDCYLHGHGTVALVNMTPRVYYVILAFIIVTMRVMKFISIAQVLVAVVIVVMQKHGVLKVAVRCIVQKRLMLLKIQIWEMRSQASK